MKQLFPFIILIALFIYSCDQSSQNDELEHKTLPQHEKKDTIPMSKKENSPNLPKEKKPEQKLLCLKENQDIDRLNQIKWSQPPKAIKEQFRFLLETETEPAKQGYTEISGTMILSQTPATIHFQFKNDSLLSCSIRISETDFDKAETIHDELVEFYTQEFGDYKKDPIEEENHFLETIHWYTSDKDITMNYDLNTGIISVSYKSNEKDKALK